MEAQVLLMTLGHTTVNSSYKAGVGCGTCGLEYDNAHSVFTVHIFSFAMVSMEVLFMCLFLPKVTKVVI